MLSDLAMPERDGYDLMRELRARGLGGRVVPIALSAQARPEDRARALAVGYRAHVTKPVDPEELIRVVRTLMKDRGQPS